MLVITVKDVVDENVEEDQGEGAALPDAWLGGSIRQWLQSLRGW